MAQAGHRWQQSLFLWLKQFGFRQCESDPCVFTMQREIRNETHRLMTGCYVDDLFILYSHDGEGSLYDTFTVALAQRWQVEDEGPVSDLLNVEITVKDGCVELTQGKYIDTLVPTCLPDGVPTSFHATHAPSADNLPALVESALATKQQRTIDPAVQRP
eukprot:2491621-Pleurochrysis_carterae.AAC.3